MLQERLLAFARECRLAAGATYVVGVSGGVDSVSLLHALVAVAPGLRLALHVAHLDHGLRGDEGTGDAAFVARLAEEWGLPATLGSADARDVARQYKLSLEAGARRARYAFFAEVVEAVGAAGVIVGHTADDQAETVLLHFLRGSGLAGLAGMPPVQWLDVAGPGGPRVLEVLRPLLSVSRAEVEAYAEKHGLAFRRDSSNADPRHLRNRIRAQLLPLLAEYNPNVRAAILRLAHLADADYQFLHRAASEAWKRVSSQDQDGVALSLAGLAREPKAIQRLLVRGAYEAVAGSVGDLEAGHVEDVLALLGKRTGSRLDLPGRVKVALTYDRLLFAPSGPPAAGLPSEGVPLAVPGTTTVEPGWQVETEVSAEPCRPPDRLSAVFDLDRVGEVLVVRRRKPGDRLRPPGLGGTKKLQDIMVDEKVPRWERDAVPVVATPAQPLWAVGLAVDEAAVPTVETRRYLCLRFHKRGTT